MNSILNHEIQHAIQHIEGFASGGNPENIRDKIEEIVHENSPAAEYARQMLKTWSGMKIAAINLGRYKDMIKSDREALRETAAEYFLML